MIKAQDNSETELGNSVTEEEEEAHGAKMQTTTLTDITVQAVVLTLAHGRHRAHLEHSLHVKHPYLNIPFFTKRAFIYFAIWIALAFFMFKKSTAQDADGNPQTTILMGKVSAPGLMLYGFLSHSQLLTG